MTKKKKRPPVDPAAAELDARRQQWELGKRKWYNIYLFAGVAINLLLYYFKPYGFDPSGSLLWGSVFGVGIPLGTMFGCTYLHEKLKGL